MNLLQGKFIGSCNTPKQIGHYTAPQWHIAACMSSIILYRWPQTSNRYHTTWPVQKLNSYILQSSCRGGMQRMIRSSNLILHTQRTYTWAINTLLYKYIQRWLPTYPISTLSVQPCMHPHTTLSPLSVQLVATCTSITTYICIAQSETIISGSKVLCRSQPLQSETPQKKATQCGTVRTYSDTMYGK